MKFDKSGGIGKYGRQESIDAAVVRVTHGREARSSTIGVAKGAIIASEQRRVS